MYTIGVWDVPKDVCVFGDVCVSQGRETKRGTWQTADIDWKEGQMERKGSREIECETQREKDGEQEHDNKRKRERERER